jgi:RNA polymerase sigma-70 factor (ECF subfamily)
MTLPGDLSHALEAVVARFRAMVLSVGARHALQSDDLDELLQDVRIRLWRGRTTSEEIRALPTSYVYQAAMSAAVDMLRRRRRDEGRSASSEDAGGTAVPSAARADDALALHDVEEAVEAALASLVPSRRMVVRMSLAGYDRREIAERLGWSDAKVRNLLSRGMEDLRVRLHARITTEESHG